MRKSLSCHRPDPTFRYLKTPPLLMCRSRPLLESQNPCSLPLLAHRILGLTAASHQNQRNQRPINTSTSTIQAAPQQPVRSRSSFDHVYMIITKDQSGRYILGSLLATEKSILGNHYFRCLSGPLHGFKTSSEPHINYIVQCPKFSSMFLSRCVK